MSYKLENIIMEKRYPLLFSQCNNDEEGDGESNDTTTYINYDINQVTDLLYIGSKKAREYIEEYKIECVISLGNSFDRNLYTEINANIEEIPISIDDVGGANIIKEIHKCNKILDRLKSENKKCLIHCFGGISRSATIVIGYLMYSEKLTAVDAYNKLKKIRPFINPNNGFWSKLSNEYEKYLKIL